MARSVRSAPASPTFYRQVVAELRKVVWPTQEQLVTYFFVVMVFVIVMIGDRLGPRPRHSESSSSRSSPAGRTHDPADRDAHRARRSGWSHADKHYSKVMEQHVSEQYDSTEVEQAHRGRGRATQATPEVDVPSVDEDVEEATEEAAEGTAPTEVVGGRRPGGGRADRGAGRGGRGRRGAGRRRGGRRGARRARGGGRGRRGGGRGRGRGRRGGDHRGAGRRGRGPARGVPPRAVGQAGRLVRGAHLLRHGEPGEVQPREPHHLPQHGGLHPRDRGPHRGGRRDQERPAQDGQAHRSPRLRAGPDGPHRRVLGRGAAHAVGDRLRRPQPPARAAEHGRGREHAGAGRGRDRRGRGGRRRHRHAERRHRREEAGRGGRLRRVATR